MPTPLPADPQPGRIEELTRSECFGLLAAGNLGRVAVVDDRGPVVFPVSFVLDGTPWCSAPSRVPSYARPGRAAWSASRPTGPMRPGETGWSVIVRGEITEVTDPAELVRLRALPLRVQAPGTGATSSGSCPRC